MQAKSKKKSVKEYFSQATREWDDLYKPDSRGNNFIHHEYRRRKELVFDFIGEIRNKGSLKAIDVGCGAGHHVYELNKKGFIAFGSDITKEMIDTAKINVGKDKSTDIKLLCADCAILPFPDNYFDVVICIGVLSYVSDEIDVLQELKRVAKKESQIIFTFPNVFKLKNILDPYYFIIRMWKYLGLRLSNMFSGKDLAINILNDNFEFPMKKYTFSQILRIIEKSGLKNTEIKGYAYGPIKFWRKQIISYKMAVRLSGFFEKRESKGFFKRMIKFPNGWVVCSHIKKV